MKLDRDAAAVAADVWNTRLRLSVLRWNLKPVVPLELIKDRWAETEHWGALADVSNEGVDVAVVEEMGAQDVLEFMGSSHMAPWK